MPLAAADLQWDAGNVLDGVTISGGDGAWDNTFGVWHNGTANTTFNNGDSAVFGGPGNYTAFVSGAGAQVDDITVNADGVGIGDQRIWRLPEQSLLQTTPMLSPSVRTCRGLWWGGPELSAPLQPLIAMSQSRAVSTEVSEPQGTSCKPKALCPSRAEPFCRTPKTGGGGSPHRCRDHWLDGAQHRDVCKQRHIERRQLGCGGHPELRGKHGGCLELWVLRKQWRYDRRCIKCIDGTTRAQWRHDGLHSNARHCDREQWGRGNRPD